MGFGAGLGFAALDEAGFAVLEVEGFALAFELEAGLLGGVVATGFVAFGFAATAGLLCVLLEVTGLTVGFLALLTTGFFAALAVTGF
jgi:hypothetical protein